MNRYLLPCPFVLACVVCSIPGAAEESPSLSPIDTARFKKVTKNLERYPKPKLPGVDLAWHMDRSMEYVRNVIDERDGCIPYYRGCVWLGPTKLAHAQWDVPHCVGRLIDISMRWEEAFGERVNDEARLDCLRTLMFESIKEDNLSHFPEYCRESKEVDWHSHREIILSLVGLYKNRSDRASLDLARRIIRGYNEHSSKPEFPLQAGRQGRFIEALLEYHRVSDDPLALEMAGQFADAFTDTFFDDKGTFPTPGNNQSTLQSVGELIEYGLYTNQERYIRKGKRIIDVGLWKIRTKWGFMFESEGPRGELNCCGDLIKAEIMLGLNGYPEYFDDAERVLRNHMLASQYLDPTNFSGPTAEEAGAKDTKKELFTNASERALGGFAFTLANDLIDPTLSHDTDVPADMVGGVTHGLLAVWNHITTTDSKGTWIHFLLSKDTDGLKIRSHIPVEGRLQLTIKRPQNVFVRIPKYVKRDKLRVTVDEKELPLRMFGRYFLIPKQSSPVEAEVRFSQELTVEEETSSGVTYRVEWLGDTVWNITPPGKQVPLFFPSRLALYGVKPR